jgi:hypothetical protein
VEQGCRQMRQDWLRGLDSNQDNQLQRLACYQLHYPGVNQKSVAEAFTGRTGIRGVAGRTGLAFLLA